MCDIFETRNLNYNLKPKQVLYPMHVSIPPVLDINSSKYLATKIWDIVPYDNKSVEKLNSCKKKIRFLKDVFVGYARNMFTM